MTAPRARSAKAPLLGRLLGGAAGKTEDAATRILQAAVEQISDFGVRRFTIDELARRVGVSRVTIYRHFPSRDEVLEGVLLHELRQFMDDIEQVVADYDSLDQKAVEGFVYALSSLREHQVLQRLLRTEPELILPLLTTHASPVLQAGREFIAGIATREASQNELPLDESGLSVLAEMLSRLVVSLLLTPDSAITMSTEEEMRAFAREYIGGVVRAFVPVPASARRVPDPAR